MSRARFRTGLIALVLTAAAGLAAAAQAAPDQTPAPRPPAAATVRPGAHDDGPHPPLVTAAPGLRRVAAVPARTTKVLDSGAVEITGLDLHDATLLQVDGTWYLYGTQYACGYNWYVAGTPWCGFAVSTAPALGGPWTAPVRLFSPTSIDPWTGTTWTVECGSTGQGCFNPRMIIRDGWGPNDSVPILWFNSPIDYSRNHANAYNAMGCASLLGPCGPGAVPHGSYNKPALTICGGNGDLGFILSGAPGGRPALICTMPGAAALNLEELNWSGSGGDGTGVRSLADLSSIEGPGGWFDQASGRYVITYSDPACGYCTGTGTGFAASTSLYSGWAAPVNSGFTPPAGGRRDVSATTCGGQPRTVAVSADGAAAYQVIDVWTAAANGDPNRNQTAADLIVAPVSFTPTSGITGQRWTPPVELAC